ncbi:MAG: ABC transporter ATP-binding protein/permease, partial [Lactobacillus sp.]|nr:ABC transporter ATP-binding protein/permease [Lactobacillus sp.]
MKKMLFKYSNKFRFVLMIIFGLIASFQNIIMANIVQTLTNIATNKNWGKIAQFLIIVIAALVVTLIASLVFNRLKTNTIKETNTYLRTHILGGMLEESKDKNNDSLGFLTNDFKLLETNRFDAQIEIIMQIFSLVLALGYALAVNWLLTLLFLVGSFIPMVVSNVFQKPIQESSEKWTSANSKYVNQTKNFLAGVETLHLYDGQNQAVAKNKKTISKLEQALSNMNLLNLDTNSWINFVGNIVTFLMPFLFGIYLVVKGQTSLGALFAIVQLANSFVNPILFILDDRSKLSTTKKIVEKVNDFLDKEKDAENRKVISLQDLQVEDLILKRGGKQLATGIDLNIKSGKKIAVIGPSGAGKSTLLQFLLYGKYGKAEAIRLNDKRVKAGTFPD